MPSSKDRQRIEVPVHFYEQLAQIAETEDRTITSVLNQLLFQALQGHQLDASRETSQPLQWACSACPLPCSRGRVTLHHELMATPTISSLNRASGWLWKRVRTDPVRAAVERNRAWRPAYRGGNRLRAPSGRRSHLRWTKQSVREVPTFAPSISSWEWCAMVAGSARIFSILLGFWMRPGVRAARLALHLLKKGETSMTETSEIWTGKASSYNRVRPTPPPALLDLLTPVDWYAASRSGVGCGQRDRTVHEIGRASRAGDWD